MNNNTSVKKNLIYSGILNIANYLFPIISMMYVSRVLSPTGLGKVSFAISVVGYFALFVQMGIPLYGIRRIAEVKDDRRELSKTTKEILTISFVLWLIVSVAYFFTINLGPKFREERQLYIILSASLLFQAIGCEWFYKALGCYKYIMTRSILIKFLSIVLIVLTIKKPEDYIIYAIISMVAGAGNNICNFINLRKHIDWKHNSSTELHPSVHIKPVLIFFFMCCATTIYGNIDTIMLGFIKGDEAVGYYHIATKLCLMLISVTGVIWNVTLPKATELWKNNKIAEFDSLSRKSMSMVCYIQIPLTVLFIMTANFIVYFMAGSGYGKSVMAARVIFLDILPIGFSNILGGQMLIPMKLEKKLLFAEVVGAISNIVTNIFAIKYLGTVGAAMTTVLSEVLVWLIALYFVKKQHPLKLFNFKKILINIFATTIAASSIIWIYFVNLPNVLTIVISFSLFFMIYYLVTYFMKDDMAQTIYNSTIGKISNDRRKNKNS